MAKSVTRHNPTSLTQTGASGRRQTTKTVSKLYHGKLRLERRNGGHTIYARTFQQGKLVTKSTGETTIRGLDAMTQERLINWGYASCDVAMRRWVDSTLAKPVGFPYPRSGVSD